MRTTNANRTNAESRRPYSKLRFSRVLHPGLAWYQFPRIGIGSLVLLLLPIVGAAAARAQPLAIDANIIAREELQKLLVDNLYGLIKSRVAVDCALARRICAITAEQEQQFKTIDDAWLLAKLKELNRPTKQLFANQLVQDFFAQQNRNLNHSNADLKVLMHEVLLSIDAAVESFLDVEQAKVYREEIDAREKFRREADAAVMVAMVERRVPLQREQRQELIDAIARMTVYDVAWLIYLTNDHWFPAIDKKLLKSILSNQQFELYQNEIGNRYQPAVISYAQIIANNEEPDPQIVIER